MNGARSWMLYGAAGHTDAAEELGLPYLALALDDPAALNAALAEVDLVLNAAGPDGATAEAWLQTGESYAFTAAASIRAVEETPGRSVPGAFSPAAAFGADFALTIPDTARIDTIPAEALARGPVDRSYLDQMPPRR